MRRATWIAGGIALALAALVAAGAWLTTTASGARWLAQTVTALAGERVRIEGVGGALVGPLTIRRLTVADEFRRIEIEGLRLEWQPRALWQRRFDVAVAAAQTVRVVALKPDPTPPELPTSLRAPLELAVRVLDVARLEVVDGGQTLRFRDLRARLDGRGGRYHLHDARVETPWATVAGEIGVGQDAPFALSGRVSAARSAPLAVTAQLALSGTLAAARFRLDAAAEGMTLFAEGEAAPFAPVRLPRLLVAGEGVDPRVFAADAPAADFAFSGLFEGRPGERLLGSFSLANRLAGRLDEGRLPLASASGAVFGDAAQADFSALALDLGAVGRFAGGGAWRDSPASIATLPPPACAPRCS